MLRLELKKQRWLERNVAVLAIQATQNHYIFRMESEIFEFEPHYCHDFNKCHIFLCCTWQNF